MQLILIAAGVATEELRCVLKEDHKSCGTLYSTSTKAVPSSVLVHVDVSSKQTLPRLNRAA